MMQIIRCKKCGKEARKTGFKFFPYCADCYWELKSKSDSPHRITEGEKGMKIVKSAVKHKGKIYTGIRHALIMQEISKEFPKDHIEIGQQGFMTDTNKFVTREEAARIAFEAGQIPNGIYSLDSYQVFPL